MELMAPYQSRGHNLYIDNWYSSPTVFEKLLQTDTNVVGTIRLNRKNMPEELKKQKLEKGDAIATYSHKMMAVKWQDEKPVTILTMMHDNIGMVDTGKTSRQIGEPAKKPSHSLTITKVWGRCVDRKDQQLASYPVMRRYLKVCKIFYLFDMMLFNVYILHRKITSQKLKYNLFRLVVAELLDGLIMPEYARRVRPAADMPIRLQAAHWAHFPQ
jgi:hypothetical protein